MTFWRHNQIYRATFWIQSQNWAFWNQVFFSFFTKYRASNLTKSVRSDTWRNWLEEMAALKSDHVWPWSIHMYARGRDLQRCRHERRFWSQNLSKRSGRNRSNAKAISRFRDMLCGRQRAIFLTKKSSCQWFEYHRASLKRSKKH